MSYSTEQEYWMQMGKRDLLAILDDILSTDYDNDATLRNTLAVWFDKAEKLNDSLLDELRTELKDKYEL